MGTLNGILGEHLMIRHFRYLHYLIVHKFWVGVFCFRRGLYWQGLIHDWSKFLPSEWGPYSRHFYGTLHQKLNGGRQKDFDRSWLLHQHRSPHHHQYWVLREDCGDFKALEIPDKYRNEMICDWRGASMARHGYDDTVEWYSRNRGKMLLHPATRCYIDRELGYLGYFEKEQNEDIEQIAQATD